MGPNKDLTFRKKGGIPVILVCDGETIPIGFHHWRFKNRLVVASLEGASPVMPITGEGLLATIFGLATWAILGCRKNIREGREGYYDFGFSFVWEITWEDISGFADPEFCFHPSSLQYVEDPSKDPIANLFGGIEPEKWPPCCIFNCGIPPLYYT